MYYSLLHTNLIEKDIESPIKYQHCGHCGLVYSSDKGLPNCIVYI